jgi:hypothetical protein
LDDGESTVRGQVFGRFPKLSAGVRVEPNDLAGAWLLPCGEPELFGAGLRSARHPSSHTLEHSIMKSQRPDDVVPGVLDQMERHTRMVRLAVFGAAAVEGLLMVVALLEVNWRDRTHILIFIFSILGYTIVVLGLLALAAHVSRVGARIVAALDARDPM